MVEVGGYERKDDDADFLRERLTLREERIKLPLKMYAVFDSTSNDWQQMTFQASETHLLRQYYYHYDC